MQGQGKNYEDCQRSHGTLSSPALSALMAGDAVVTAVCMSRVSISNPPLIIIIVVNNIVIFKLCMSHIQSLSHHHHRHRCHHHCRFRHCY